MGLGTDVKKQAGRGSSRSSSTELQSWGTTELGNGRARLGVFAFVRGPEPVCGTTGSSTPAFTGTQTWEAPLSVTHVWDKVILV